MVIDNGIQYKQVLVGKFNVPPLHTVTYVYHGLQ